MKFYLLILIFGYIQAGLSGVITTEQPESTTIARDIRTEIRAIPHLEPQNADIFDGIVYKLYDNSSNEDGLDAMVLNKCPKTLVLISRKINE